MAYEYTTAGYVEAELRATASFDTTTNPTLSSVTRWIQEASDEVNQKSGRIWGSTSYSEDIDYQGEETITLKHSPIISVTSVLYSTSALGTTTYALSDTKTEDTDYTTYTDSGEISIIPSNWSPSDGRKRIQINYNAGYTTVPERIQALTTKKVSKRILDTVMQQDINEKKSGKSVSVGSISIVKPADFGSQNYKQLLSDIRTIEDDLLKGTGVYRIGHRY